MPRTRSVYPADELAHKWAHGATSLRNSSTCGGSRTSTVFCDSNTIYSFGHHFPMARRLVRRRGKFLTGSLRHDDRRSDDQIIFLVNPQSYSQRTNRHQSYVRRAISGVGTQFTIDPSLWKSLIDRDGKAIAAHFQQRISGTGDRNEDGLLNQFSKAKRKITKARLALRAANLIDEFAALKKFFRLPSGTVKLPKELRDYLPLADQIVHDHGQSVTAAAKTRSKNRSEAARIRNQRRAELVAAITNENDRLVADWRAGRPLTVTIPSEPSPVKVQEYEALTYGTGAGSARLRLQPGADRIVETSLGARLPLTAFKAALTHLRTLTPGQYPDFTVSNYRGLTLNGTSLRIGCHTIAYTELNAFLSTLSLPPYEPPNA